MKQKKNKITIIIVEEQQRTDHMYHDVRQVGDDLSHDMTQYLLESLFKGAKLKRI